MLPSLPVSALVEVLVQGEGVTYATCGGIWLMTLFAEPKTADMLLARTSLQAMARRHPDGFPALTWVHPSAGYSMEAEARKTAAAVTDEFARSLRAQATLVEGAGFQVATVRAIISGIDMLSRSKAPKKTFAELRPCVAWCLQHRAAPGGGSPDDIAAAIDGALRRRPGGRLDKCLPSSVERTLMSSSDAENGFCKN